MFNLLKTVHVINRNIRTSAINIINDGQDIVLKTVVQTKIKSEEEIKEIITNKLEEYHKLVKTESPESTEITKQIAALDLKLRKTFGFSQHEDLTQFPLIKFDDLEIDNQLNSSKIKYLKFINKI